MTKNEAVSYLKMLLLIASADQTISNNEISYFNDIGKNLGLSLNEIDEVVELVKNKSCSIEEIAADITDQETKFSLVENLLNLCYADGTYSLAEKSGVTDICILLDINATDLQKLEKRAEAKNKIKGFFSNGKSVGTKTIQKLSAAFEAGRDGVFATGKKISDGSIETVHSITAGINNIGSKISFSMEKSKRVKEENAELRERLKNDTVSEAVKQKVITMLHSKIKSLNKQLKEEQQRNSQNEEMIKMLQAQLDDLESTMIVA